MSYKVVDGENNSIDFKSFTEDNEQITVTSIGGTSNPNLDAFGRIRISDPVTIFDNVCRYNDSPLFFETSTTGGGSSTHLPDESAVRMDLGTADGDRVIRQTFQYFRYQPAKSQLIEMTGVLGAAKTNVIQRLGYFDDSNGLFFEQDENSFNVVVRTSTSGSPTETTVQQSTWNLDKLDGTGQSGVTIDTTKAQIFVIDFQWLGAGKIRFGFSIGGKLIYCHQVVNANLNEEVYMSSGSLPIRYEIVNTGVTASPTSMKQICCSLQSEGGFKEDLSFTQSASNGATTVPVTTRRPILSIRGKTSFNGITNRGIITPLEVDIINLAASAFYEIVWNGTLTGASFSSVGDDSITEFDTSATAISGGVVLDSGYIPIGVLASDVAISNLIKNKLRIANNIAGNETSTVSVVCTSLGGATGMGASLAFSEVY